MAEDINNVTCCDCGIEFHFSKKIEEMWRKSEKTFFCPNGHKLVWNKPEDETPEQKELKSLRGEVTELKGKLEAALKDVEAEKKRADELALELEIWHPTDRTTQGD